jgi:hypothetical protein
MTKRILFLAAVLLAAAPAYGQLNCSYPNSNGIGIVDAPPLGTVCAAGKNGTTYVNNRVASSTEFCVETNYDTTYATHQATVVGYGQTHCATISNYQTPCYADTDQSMTRASHSTAYNQFYLRTYDMSYLSNGTCSRNGVFHQDFWECVGASCACPEVIGCQEGYVWNPTRCQCMKTSPIVLDITGKGFELTDAAHGVLFDIAATGHPVQMGWTAPGSDNAFLCLPDADGRCDDGKDLFGNFTPQPPSMNPNGFAALAVYDDPKSGGNGDGIIDARDRIFKSLRLWIDKNHDGISQLDELYTLPTLGINSISLAYTEIHKLDQYGNEFRYRARLNPDKATDAGKIVYDIFFVISNSTVVAHRSVQRCPVTEK